MKQQRSRKPKPTNKQLAASSRSVRAERTATRKKLGTSPSSAESGILAWEDDPMSAGASPVERPVPDVASGNFTATLFEAQPSPARYAPDTKEFRYWAATDAIHRALDFWGSLVPKGTKFRPSASSVLPVKLNAGLDLNAYYYPDRGLEFHHAVIANRRVHFSESPDIVLHEVGHAVLDALRPELFDALSIEAAAFHESFGDISSLLVGLQLPSLRDAVLGETGGSLYRTSRLSRMAESLAWCIRQSRPDRVPPDCLRNAVNSWLYRDPRWLPTDGPDSELTSAPHNLSRVFTGGFFEALSGMFAAEGTDSKALASVGVAAGEMMVKAVCNAPVETAYFASVAEMFIDAAPKKYRDAVVTAMVRRGLVPVSRLGGSKARGGTAGPGRGMAGSGAQSSGVKSRQLGGNRFGLTGLVLEVHAPMDGGRYRGAAHIAGTVASERMAPDGDADDAEIFAELLFRRGRVDTSKLRSAKYSHNRYAHKTHKLLPVANGFTCRRIAFDCGFSD
jgi:hypothetical protein